MSGTRHQFLRTANVYTHGTSEVILGRALKGRRHRVVVASKVGGKAGSDPDQKGLSPAAIRRAIEESLRRLETDYLDLYYLHVSDPAVLLEETLDAMHQLVPEARFATSRTPITRPGSG